jgi:hypothetical protein
VRNACDAAATQRPYRAYLVVIPHRLIFVWTGPCFPAFARLAVESALLSDPDAAVEIHLFGDATRTGGELQHVAGYERVAVHAVDLPAIFEGLPHAPEAYLRLLERLPPTAASARANLVRYALLHQRGGVYLDCDLFVLRSLRPLLVDEAFVGEELVWSADEARVAGGLGLRHAPAIAGWLWSYALRRADAHALGGRGWLEPLAARAEPWWAVGAVNNAVIGAAPRAGFLRRVLDEVFGADPAIRYALGPSLVTRVARAGDVNVLPPSSFYAVPPSASFTLFEGRAVALPDDAYAIHYTASNHKRALARLDRAALARRRDGATFYQLAASVAARAASLARRARPQVVGSVAAALPG